MTVLGTILSIAAVAVIGVSGIACFSAIAIQELREQN